MSSTATRYRLTRTQESPHRVLLINGWSDDNRGDAAIVLGLVRLIDEQIDIAPSFTVVSSFSRGSSFFAEADRHTRSVVDDVLPSPLPVLSDGQSKLGRQLIQLWRIGQGTALLLLAKTSLGRLVATREQRELLAAFEETQLVVGKGGHMYFSGGGIRGLLTLYQNLYPMLLAERCGVPTAVHAQSIGPVKGGASRWLLREALQRVGAIHTREQPSQDFVTELLGHDRANFAWDTAFALPAEAIPRDVSERLPESFVAITIRQWHFPYTDDGANEPYQAYLTSIASVVRTANTQLGLPVVLVPQVTGPTELEDDRIAVEELMQLIPDANVIVIDEDISPGQLRDLYARADVLVGTRFHSVILALAAGTPSLAISYHGFKTTGIMNRLGLDDFVFDIGAVESNGLVNTFLALHADREAVAAHIDERIADVLADSRDQIQSMLIDSGIYAGELTA